MPDALLPIPALKQLAFGSTRLHRYLVGLEDTFGPRFATHEVWGRDGALEEHGGAGPLKTKVRLKIPGAAWRSALAEVLEPILRKPRDVLVHPVYGKKNMVLKSPARGGMDFPREGACYSIELLFSEAAQDQALLDPGGVSAAAQRTTEQATQTSKVFTVLSDALLLKYRIGAYAQQVRQYVATAQAAISEFVAFAQEYSALAVTQFTVGTLSSTIDTAAQGVMRLADATVLSLRRLGDLNSYEAVMSVERTAAYARDLRDEITATMPVPIVFTVWQTTSLDLLVQNFYPGRTWAQAEEIEQQLMRMNSLPRYDVILAGTKMLRPSL